MVFSVLTDPLSVSIAFSDTSWAPRRKMYVKHSEKGVLVVAYGKEVIHQYMGLSQMGPEQNEIPEAQPPTSGNSGK